MGVHPTADLRPAVSERAAQIEETFSPARQSGFMRTLVKVAINAAAIWVAAALLEYPIYVTPEGWPCEAEDLVAALIAARDEPPPAPPAPASSPAPAGPPAPIPFSSPGAASRPSPPASPPSSPPASAWASRP